MSLSRCNFRISATSITILLCCILACVLLATAAAASPVGGDHRINTRSSSTSSTTSSSSSSSSSSHRRVRSTTLTSIATLGASTSTSTSTISSSSHSHSDILSVCQLQQDLDLSGIWVKHDRAVVEVFHINITCTENCGVDACMKRMQNQGSRINIKGMNQLPSYTAFYLDGALAGHNTFNVTAVGDQLSLNGAYNNFADDSGNLACPAPFTVIFEDDTNVVLVSYAATYGTVCGDYTGDSARYYRQSALQ